MNSFERKSAFNQINALLLMLLTSFLALTVLFMNGDKVSAATNEFDVEQYNAHIDYKESLGGGFSASSTLFDVQGTGNNLVSIVLDVGFDILALVFIFGVVGIAMGVTLQNGQWTKWSTTAMYGTFLSIICIRIIPIIALTIDQIGITLVINHIIQLCTRTGFFIAIIMFLIGLFLRSLNKIFEHPKYFRWGRSLLFGSLIIITLVTFSPIVIMSL